MDEARGSYHHGNLRPALVASALDLARDGGATAVSLRAVAERAGVSRAAPYHHFKDKEDLLAAAGAEGFGMLMAELERATTPLADPWLRLRSMGRAYVRFAIRERELMRMLFGDCFPDKSLYPDLQAAGQRCFQFLLHTIEGCAATPQARPLPPHIMAMTSWSLVHGLAMLRADGTTRVLHLPCADTNTAPCPINDDEMTEKVLDAMVAALRL